VSKQFKKYLTLHVDNSKHKNMWFPGLGKSETHGLKCIKAEKRLELLEEELTETNKKLMQLEKEQSNPVPQNIRGKYWLTCVSLNYLL
jgi:DNA-binding transcriptional MerR regulator